MFTKVDALIWSDTKYRSLTDDGKLLFLYVLTCNHRNILGFYHLPIQYGSYDMNWEMERFSKGLHELLDKGFINYNFNTNIILIPNYLKYNPLENQNQVKGAMKALDSIPTNGLDVDIISTLEGLRKPFIKPLIELFHKRLGKHVDVDVDVDVEVDVDGVEEEVAEEEITHSADTKKIIDLYKEKLKHLPQPRKITTTRRNHVKARINDYGVDEVIAGLVKASKSLFLAGENDRGWKADFDWIFKPDNFAKILEDKYNNNVEQQAPLGIQEYDNSNLGKRNEYS